MKKLLYSCFIAALFFFNPHSQSIRVSFSEKKLLSTDKDLLDEDQMDLAAQQEVQLTKDPLLGFVPRERLMHAIQYAEEQQNAETRGAIPGIIWKERGPNNVGGRTQSIMIDPNDGTKKTVF